MEGEQCKPCPGYTPKRVQASCLLVINGAPLEAPPAEGLPRVVNCIHGYYDSHGCVSGAEEGGVTLGEVTTWSMPAVQGCIPFPNIQPVRVGRVEAFEQLVVAKGVVLKGRVPE